MAKKNSVTVIAHERSKPARRPIPAPDKMADNEFMASDAQFDNEQPGHPSSIDGINHLKGAISLLKGKRV